MSNESIGILSVAFFFYMIPTIIAIHKKHKHLIAIGAFNLFLGWSGILWIVAFVWSLTNGKKQSDEMRELIREMKELQERTK